MEVRVYCLDCDDIDNEGFIEHRKIMNYVGPLTISSDKTQCQGYECPICNKLIQVCINTLQQQKGEQ